MHNCLLRRILKIFRKWVFQSRVEEQFPACNLTEICGYYQVSSQNVLRTSCLKQCAPLAPKVGICQFSFFLNFLMTLKSNIMGHCSNQTLSWDLDVSSSVTVRLLHLRLRTLVVTLSSPDLPVTEKQQLFLAYSNSEEKPQCSWIIPRCKLLSKPSWATWFLPSVS